MYSSPNSSSEFLKMMITEGVKTSGIDLLIKEVNNTESFIKESIMSTPAFKIEKTLYTRKSKSLKEFGNELIEEIISKAPKTSYENLILPISLSEEINRSTLNYASNVAEAIKVNIIMLHVYHPFSAESAYNLPFA